MQDALTEPSRPAANPRDEADRTLADLYAERLLPMVRLAHLLTGSNVVAQDMVQDAFMKVAPHIDHLDNPNAYLRQAVVNECRQWFRRREVETRYERSEEASRSFVTLPPELDETWTALSGLSERRRTALVLRYYEDLTIDQIADTLDCRPGTAKALIHRGLKSLKEIIDSGN